MDHLLGTRSPGMSLERYLPDTNSLYYRAGCEITVKGVYMDRELEDTYVGVPPLVYVLCYHPLVTFSWLTLLLGKAIAPSLI